MPNPPPPTGTATRGTPYRTDGQGATDQIHQPGAGATITEGRTGAGATFFSSV
ncbi:hypothetical protein GFS31_08200 [Leptolyngbya sp. BL0902]|uniref:hypothetical protein n=1 Tax=Leptolyngbya sp. BL0902 TaxID=1115757 RepID=UPI0018E87F50|nr:hypothetical protein [Leptolyngbya sp. BL0902]QQE64141.1 hypothetical protein GFS31_08200 [Leptolyngbya sp. BL0902]